MGSPAVNSTVRIFERQRKAEDLRVETSRKTARLLGRENGAFESVREDEMSISTESPSAEEILTSLRCRLSTQHFSNPDTVLISELGLCQGNARIDLAAVNGQIHGYEIKSDRDSLRRLHTQVGIYGKVFDRVSLVCSRRHIEQAANIIPSWWGVLRVEFNSRGLEFKAVKRGRQNPHRDTRSLAEFLWKDEAVALLKQKHVKRGLSGKRRTELWETLCESFTLDEIAGAVRAHLKATAAIRGRPG